MALFIEFLDQSDCANSGPRCQNLINCLWETDTCPTGCQNLIHSLWDSDTCPTGCHRGLFAQKPSKNPRFVFISWALINCVYVHSWTIKYYHWAILQNLSHTYFAKCQDPDSHLLLWEMPRATPLGLQKNHQIFLFFRKSKMGSKSAP